MLAGFVLVLAGSVPAAFVPMFVAEHTKRKESLVHLLGPRALVFLALPVAISAVPLLFLNHRRRRMVWNLAAFLIGMWILITGPIGIYYIFGAGAIVWGVMKASRAEGPAGLGFGRFRRPVRAEAESET